MKQFNSWRFYWQAKDTSRLENIGEVLLSFLLHCAKPFNEANNGFYTQRQAVYWGKGH